MNRKSIILTLVFAALFGTLIGAYGGTVGVNDLFGFTNGYGFTWFNSTNFDATEYYYGGANYTAFILAEAGPRNPFDQTLNTTDAVTFVNLTLTGDLLNTFNVTQSLQYPQHTPSYIVWVDSGLYYAKNTPTGEIQTNANIETLGQTLADSLVDGGQIFFKTGTYYPTGRIRTTNPFVSFIGEKGTIFDGNGSDPGNNVITLNADNCRVSNIEFFNFTGTKSIVQVGTSINCEVDRCVFDTVPEGIRTDNSEYILIHKNEIKNINYAYGIRLVGTRDSLVYNNYIHDYNETSGRGISISQNALNPTHRITISDNRIINVYDDSAIAVDAHLFASDFVSNITVQNNYILNCGDVGIFVEGDLVAARRNNYITVKNNFVAQCDLDGIRITLCDYFKVIENTCIDNGQDAGGAVDQRNGINIWNSRFGLIYLNHAVDKGGGTQRYGIYEHSANSSNNTVMHNFVANNTVAEIVASAPATSNIRIKDNTGFIYQGDTRYNSGNLEMWNSTAWVIIGP